MATDLTKADVTISLKFQHTVGNALFAEPLTKTVGGTASFTTGAGAKQANRLAVNLIQIPASETLTIDLTPTNVTYALSGGGSGSILDPNNEAIAFARVKALFFELDVVNRTNPSLDCTVNGGAANVVTSFKADLVTDGTVNARAAVERTDATGWAVTNSTVDKIVVVNNQAKIAYLNVGILGAAT